MFLIILQNSQENTCAGIPFLMKLLAPGEKETALRVFSCEFCEIFKITFLKKISVRVLLDRIQIKKYQNDTDQCKT